MKKKIVVSLVLITVIIASVGIYQYPKARWRAGLCISKVIGDLPDVTWSDLAATTLPRSIAIKLNMSALTVDVQMQGEGPCSVLWKNRLGSFWGRSGDEESLQIGLKNLLVEEIYFGSHAKIQPGDVVFDGGSHLGTFTRLALTQQASLVVAFEPDKINGACYRKTFMEEIKEGRVILIQEALWDKVGRISFSEGASSADGKVLQSDSSSETANNELELPATTVDETVRRLKLERVDFIKLHIEGSERQALLGAKVTLVRFKPRILVALDHRPADPKVIPQMILDMVPGYQIQMRGKDQACFFME